jgi:hypothetical protein
LLGKKREKKTYVQAEKLGGEDNVNCGSDKKRIDILKLTFSLGKQRLRAILFQVAHAW